MKAGGHRAVLHPLGTALVGLAALLALASCGRSQGGSTAEPPTQPVASMDTIGAVPLGDVAGAAESTLATSIPNPYENNPQAVQQGHDLFIKMNCAGCHGYGAKGGMGPNLTDTYWRYGGVPASIYKSIYEGRPQGMPAWNPALPPDDIWKLVAYIESLGGAYTPAQYQAQLQGDHLGENVAPEVKSTLSGAAAAPPFRLKSSSESAPDVQARPDAGGETAGNQTSSGGQTSGGDTSNSGNAPGTAGSRSGGKP